MIQMSHLIDPKILNCELLISHSAVIYIVLLLLFKENTMKENRNQFVSLNYRESISCGESLI